MQALRNTYVLYTWTQLYMCIHVSFTFLTNLHMTPSPELLAFFNHYIKCDRSQDFNPAPFSKASAMCLHRAAVRGGAVCFWKVILCMSSSPLLSVVLVTKLQYLIKYFHILMKYKLKKKLSSVTNLIECFQKSLKTSHS